MALGDLVQMLEGLRGGSTCLGCNGGLGTVDDGSGGGGTYTCPDGTVVDIGSPCPTISATPSAPKTDWTPWVLGGAALVAVWALFFREPRG